MKADLIKAAMPRHTKTALALLTVVLLAGCRYDDAILDDNYQPATYQEQYPIRVAEAPVKMKLSAKAGTLRPDQLISVINFAKDARGNASSRIAVRWASGSAKSRKVAQEIATVLVDQGVPQSMIATGSYSGSAAVVSLTFMRKVAVTTECGDWSENLAGNRYNKSYKNFGCATQHNTAAMVANPEDFESARPMTPTPAASRSGAMTKYNTGAAF